MKLQKIAFSADAFLIAIMMYQDKLFSICDRYGKFLLEEEDLRQMEGTPEVNEIIIRNWKNLEVISLPTGLTFWQYLDRNYPDNFFVVVSSKTLTSFMSLSKIIPYEDIFTPRSLGELISPKW